MLDNIPLSQDLLFGFYLLLSLLFGYIIGAERESRGKEAGVGTQCLVIAGSMAFCFLSNSVDPLSTSRIASNVVTGIGFLGAGLIFFNKSKDRVINLTTAATIWVSAAIGMALGFGYIFIALTMTVFSVFALRIRKAPILSQHRKNLD